MANILIAGAGRLGSALFEALQNQHHLTVLRARADDRPNVVSADLAALSAQQISDLQQQLPAQIDYAFFILSPRERGEAAYRQTYLQAQQHLLQLLQGKNLRHYFFVSSTAVYAQDAGEWLDENSPTEPTAYNGRIMLQAEQLAATAGAHTVVRLSGIVGPQPSHILQAVRRWLDGDPEATPVAHWSNRIHYRDAVGILQFLLERHAAGRAIDNCYIGSNSEPTLNTQLYPLLANHFFGQTLAIPEDIVPCTGKRLSNEHIRQTGYRFLADSSLAVYETP